MAQERINIADLDFDQIKSSLKEFLRGQSEFTDYDFEGSGINILLDILAANTHQIGFYQSMVANEAFIDTAVTRESLVSLSKLLGYTPRSRSAARATVNVNFGTTRPSQNDTDLSFLPTGSIFRAEVNGTSYDFVTTQPYKILQNSSDEYYCENVQVVEGAIRTTSFIVDETNENQKFLIDDTTIDTTTIVVRVANSVTDNTGFNRVWKRNTDYTSIGPESRVFFLEENVDTKYRIFFGDGIFGRKPRNGNQIVVQYLSTQGPDANGIGRRDSATNRAFVSIDFPTSTVTVVAPSSGGADRESINSIRFNAPRSFQTQDRAVTAQDYRSVINREYGNAESVFVWGGEENDPPQYGKVFISIKPTSGTSLSDVEKTQIAQNILKSRNVLGITPEVVDPEFLYLKINSRVVYDPSQTEKTSAQISSLVSSGIFLFSDNDLEKFDRSLEYSSFVNRIDNFDVSIRSNQTDIMLEKRLSVDLGVNTSYEIRFDNALFNPEDGYKPIISSTAFTINDTDGVTPVTAYLDDNGSGTIRVYKLVNSQKVFINASAGTVNYTTGTINLVNFQPLSVPNNDSQIRITAEPENLDVTSRRNNILLIDREDPESVRVTATAYTTIDENETSSGTPFPFNTG